MKNNATFAVVDIETTGTNPTTDRIIQFGCVFVKNNQIVSRFATDVNPKMKITKQIENLTGITNEQVARAPYFEDVAAEIARLLADCVFVAHNIYFDYQFLSKELTRCGVPELTIAGIDTVELAQIFLPTSASFRLSDLAEQYGIDHDRPHQADSDAEVTAELMLVIEERMRSLPLVTMEKLVILASECGMETAEYIEMVYQEMLSDIRPLRKGIQLVNGLALQKKEVIYFVYDKEHESEYPHSKSEKATLYQEFFDYRETQSKMMNLVYDFFSTPVSVENGKLGHKNFALEASTGSGKTFGYLLPLSYLATPEKPVIISTVSLLLESQIVEKDLPLVNRIRPGSLVATLVKSHRHFIDIDRFASTLTNPVKQKQYALYQMGVLVWLTETQTGDLDELNLTTYNHIFFKQVKHQGTAFLSKNSSYYADDFWRHLQRKIKQSNVIVINHAFLCQENYRETPLLPKSPYLIIDEAHHLPEIAQRAGFMQISDYQITKQLMQLTNGDNHPIALSKLWKHDDWHREVKSLRTILYEAVDVFETVKEDIIEAVLIDHGHTYDQEILISNESLANMPVYMKKNLSQFSILLKEGRQLYQRIEQVFLLEIDKWTASEKFLMTEWLSDLAQFAEFSRFFDGFIQPSSSDVIKWLKIKEKNQQITASYSDFSASIVAHSRWYPRYDKILYTGGTIRVGKDTQYLGRTLGIDYVPFRSLPSTYDYSQQARLYVPTEANDYRELSSPEYIDFVSQTLKKIARQERRSLLVLFTSHDMLQKVYQKIHYELLTEGVEVLAQGLSGSREKIVKRFSHSAHTVLLGTDSFWEGVDLPGESLEIIIVTRLPFESPERPFIKEKYQYLKDNGIDSFNKYALPKAALRLRQGLGRLIRSERDKGVLLVLDRRLIKAKYGARMIKALPSDLPLIEESLDDILKDLKEFL
ncbi:ribonuclease H-like domain-containing protein [Vagococcus sp. BWB3-3]|uniref:3'-5' exonuclease DinG n=1 Tax=Vagococcus allomyrinae TaxID=2794353 RepID=A0A940PGL7_9ENTE|nr:ribonuclease H-like domain-containing protein [Vagococcus allomyrinae]